MKSVCLAMLLPVLLAACASAPRVAEAPVPTPLQWQMPMSDAGEGSDAGFWSGFASPELDRLLQRAAIANPDLQIAVRRLRIADDAERLAAAGKRPALDFQAGPVDNTAVAVNGGRRSAAVYRLGFEASYELDFWGRIDSQIVGAKADTAGRRFEAGAARIAMADELAHRYFDIAEADEVRVLLQRRAALADERWTLETARQAAGRIDAGPVLEAQRARNQLQDELADWQQRRQQDIWQLALLCGELPEAFTLAASPLRQAIRRPSVPSGLPSSLLQRRPDLQAASSRLQAAQAQIGVAWAEQFPQIRLTAELGVASDVLHRVLSGAILRSASARRSACRCLMAVPAQRGLMPASRRPKSPRSNIARPHSPRSPMSSWRCRRMPMPTAGSANRSRPRPGNSSSHSAARRSSKQAAPAGSTRSLWNQSGSKPNNSPSIAIASSSMRCWRCMPHSAAAGPRRISHLPVQQVPSTNPATNPVPKR